jgi:penicillin-binding protein 1A
MDAALRGPRVVVENLADGGLLYWLFKLYLFAGIVLGGIGLAIGAGLYIHFARGLPPVPELSRYASEAPGLTTVVALDGTLLGEFATERREVVPLSKIPQPLIDAFVATEDRRFFSHGGIDLRGLLRAMVTNFRAGQVQQGGSTITQQVAKAYLSSERSYSRKIKEAIFARRLEARYGKREILSLYLNHIFLGAGAFGVQAASRRYFDQDVWELDLGQLALLAGLARAPSRDSPLTSEPAAIARRNEVIANLVEVGSLKKDEADKWKASPLGLSPRKDPFRDVAPYFTEQVRRDLVKKYGQKGFYEGGYRVETTVLPWLDVLAQDNVDHAVRKLDKRQGWRGPEAKLTDPQAALFRTRSAELYGKGPLEEERLYLALVEKVSQGGASVRVGTDLYNLPLEKMSWASSFSAKDATNDKLIESATTALKKGDVVWVRSTMHSAIPRFSDFSYDELGEAVWTPEKLPSAKPSTKISKEVLLEQSPRVAGSLYTYDHRTGYVLAMSGGDDFDRSEFNRVVQACRQPGSAYKPIYYSLALDHGYDYSTPFTDKPKAEIDPNTGELWIPQNVDGSYGQVVSLERALVWSKNPPSVEIFRLVGTKDAASWAERLGIRSPLVTSDKCVKEFCSSLALGASCVHLDEITDAFAVFARNGRPVQPVRIRRVLDRRGRVLEDHTVPDDPFLSESDRLDRIAAIGVERPAPVIEPRTAYLTSRLLREIVTQGHSAPIRATKVPAAGKTGTSSRTSDVWFIGYTSAWMTTAWIGDDTYQRQLGYKDASFMLSVPMWARYMYAATKDQPLAEIPWEVPPGVKPSDRGGPLKTGFPPAPVPGQTVGGKPVLLPEKLQNAHVLKPGETAPANLAPERAVRVPTGIPRPPKLPSPTP